MVSNPFTTNQNKKALKERKKSLSANTNSVVLYSLRIYMHPHQRTETTSLTTDRKRLQQRSGNKKNINNKYIYFAILHSFPSLGLSP